MPCHPPSNRNDRPATSWPDSVAMIVCTLRPFVGTALVLVTLAFCVPVFRAGYIEAGPVLVVHTP